MLVNLEMKSQAKIQRTPIKYRYFNYRAGEMYMVFPTILLTILQSIWYAHRMKEHRKELNIVTIIPQASCEYIKVNFNGTIIIKLYKMKTNKKTKQHIIYKDTILR